MAPLARDGTPEASCCGVGRGDRRLRRYLSVLLLRGAVQSLFCSIRVCVLRVPSRLERPVSFSPRVSAPPPSGLQNLPVGDWLLAKHVSPCLSVDLSALNAVNPNTCSRGTLTLSTAYQIQYSVPILYQNHFVQSLSQVPTQIPIPEYRYPIVLSSWIVAGAGELTYQAAAAQPSTFAVHA